MEAKLSRELALDLSNGLIAEISQNQLLAAPGLNWTLVQAILTLQLEGVPIEKALDVDWLGELANSTINFAVQSHRASFIDQTLHKLLHQPSI